MDLKKERYIPYPGIPPEKTAEMEKCVNDVMGRGKDKSSAIAICHVSIMGDKKKPASAKVMAAKKGEIPMINLNFYGDYWKGKLDDKSEMIEEETEEISTIDKSKEKDSIDESIGKDPIEKNSIGKEVNKESMKTKDEEKKVSADTKVMADKEKAVEPEEKIEKADPDKGEEKNEMAVCMKGAMADGKSEAEAKKHCKAQMASEEKDEEKVEKKEDKPVEKTEERPADIQEAADVSALLKSVIEKIDKLVQKQDVTPAEDKPVDEKPVDAPVSAPAEGAAPKEEAPVGGESVTPKEEAPVEGASPEGADVQKAVGDLGKQMESSLAKVTEAVDSLKKSFEKEIEEVKDRVNKLEEQEVPSKVASTIVVSKSDNSGNLSATEQERLTSVLKELGELEAMQKDNIEKYQNGKYWEKAIRLVDEKNSLLVKKQTGQSVIQI